MSRKHTVPRGFHIVLYSNVYRMELLGAKVHPVTSGTCTLKDAVNACMREWNGRVEDTLYVLGSVMGPHPFPMIGDSSRRQRRVHSLARGLTADQFHFLIPYKVVEHTQGTVCAGYR